MADTIHAVHDGNDAEALSDDSDVIINSNQVVLDQSIGTNS